MIFLIRHGQTEFNVEGRLQGWLDSPLTPLGVQQARRMGRILRSLMDDPDTWSIVSSPLGRARRTAEIVRAETGLVCDIRLDERLAEAGGGDWEGLTRDEIRILRPDLDPNVPLRRLLLTASGGEGEAALDRRLTDWLSEIDEADGRRRIVVSHGGAGQRLRQIYTGAPADTGEPPPQDAVFLLNRGKADRVDQDQDAPDGK